MSAYLQMDGLSKSYGRVPALADVTLGVGRREVLAVLGPNGAGKSTLFSCLLGLASLDAGRISLEGQPVSEANRRRFGYLAERVALYPHRTTLDNVLWFARLKACPDSDAREQISRLGLGLVASKKVSQLSKGMLQRVGLAIALCGKPELLILDEPFNGLDPSLLDSLQAILKEEQDRGATLLISTHTMSAVEPLATHAAILLNGRLVALGSLGQLQQGYSGSESLEAIYHGIARSCAVQTSEGVFA